MSRRLKLLALPVLAAALSAGCSAAPLYSGPAFDGRWAATDAALGSVLVVLRTATGGGVDGELTDARGKRWDLDGSPSMDAPSQGGKLELELDASDEPGLLTLVSNVNDPAKIQGTMNYAGGDVVVILLRHDVSGAPFIEATFQRASRPEATRRDVRLAKLPDPPPPPPAPQ